MIWLPCFFGMFWFGVGFWGKKSVIIGSNVKTSHSCSAALEDKSSLVALIDTQAGCQEVDLYSGVMQYCKSTFLWVSYVYMGYAQGDSHIICVQKYQVPSSIFCAEKGSQRYEILFNWLSPPSESNHNSGPSDVRIWLGHLFILPSAKSWVFLCVYIPPPMHTFYTCCMYFPNRHF